MAVPLLLPDPRPRMGPERRTQRHLASEDASPWLARLGGAELDAAEVLGADVAVLAGADQPGRGAVVAVERAAVETVGDQHVLGQGVLDRHDRPVAVETAEDDVRDRRVRVQPPAR